MNRRHLEEPFVGHRTRTRVHDDVTSTAHMIQGAVKEKVGNRENDDNYILKKSWKCMHI